MTLWVGPEQDPDRYQLLHRHSAGGEGELWRGQLQVEELLLPVAIKIAHTEVVDASDPEHQGGVPSPRSTDPAMPPDTRRWQQQAELLRTLDHPALVRVREVFVGAPPHDAGGATPATAQRLFLVMNWVEGRTAARWVTEAPQRSVADVLEVLQPVADALDHLHLGRDTGGIPILHRDVKPGNIIMDGERTWLVDFGLARVAASRSLSVAGTLAYLAPEILEGEPFTPATDRYALGATAYHLLTGSNPRLHRPDETREVLEAAVAQRAGGDLTASVLAMLDTDADRRPESATAWLAGLWRAAGQASGAPVPPPPRPPEARPALTEPRTVRRPGQADVASADEVAEHATVSDGRTRTRRPWRSPVAASLLALVVVAVSGWLLAGDRLRDTVVPLPAAGWERAELAAPAPDEHAVPLGVTRFEDGFVAVGVHHGADGRRAAVWTATAPDRWSPTDADPAVFPADSVLFDVAATDDGLVAAGAVVIDGTWQPALWRSGAGTDWARTCCDSDPSGEEGVVTAVAADREQAHLVAVGRRSERGAVWVSDDARTWRAVPGEESGLPDDSGLEAVTATPDGWLSVGAHEDRAGVWRSEDGRRWESAAGRDPLPAGSALYGVTWSTRTTVVVGTSGERPAVWSKDDEGWQRRPSPADLDGRLHAVASIDGEVVAVGQGRPTGEAGPEQAFAWRGSADGPGWRHRLLDGGDQSEGASAALGVTDTPTGALVVGGEPTSGGVLERGLLWVAP